MNPIGLDAVYEKVADTQQVLSTIARLQGVHGRRLDDAKIRYLDFSIGLSRIESAVDAANGRLDLIEETLNAHGAKLEAHGERLDEIIRLLRKDQ